MPQAHGPHPAPSRPDVSLVAPALEALVAEALRNSPDLASLTHRIAGLERGVAPAGALPDPMISAKFRDMGLEFLPHREQVLMFGVQQNLLFPGKTASREALAHASVEIGQSQRELLARQIVRQIRSLYANIYAHDQTIQILDDTHELLKAMEDNLASRYATGQINLEALLKVQYAISNHDLERTQTIGERNMLLPILNRLLARPASQALGQVKQLPAIPDPPNAALLQEHAVQGSAAVALARKRVLQAERQLALSKLDLKPNLIAGAALGSERGSPSIELSLGVELPLWQKRKQRPLIGVAESSLAEAQSQLQAAEADARAEANRLIADWERANHRLHLIREALLPQARAAFEAAQQTFRTGQTDFSTVIEDFNLLLSANLEAFNAQAACFSIWAQIQEWENL